MGNEEGGRMFNEYNFICPNCHRQYHVEAEQFMCQCGQTFRKRGTQFIDQSINLTPFLTYYVELLATIAKIDKDDGDVSVTQFEQLLQDYQLSKQEMDMCLKQFRDHPDRTYEKSMLFALHHYNTGVEFKSFLLYGCVFMAFANQAPTPRQHEVLDDVIAIFNISEAVQKDVLAEVRRERYFAHEEETKSLNDPHLQLDYSDQPLDYYQLLNVQHGCSLDQLKQAYRDLMKQYHPDRIECAALPADIKALMTRKTIQIQLEYESIKKVEGFSR